MTDKIVVLSACATQEEAERLALLLVEERLAACVNVLPQVRSFYRWKGKVESAGETMLLIKSSRALFPQLRAALETAHSYELPEALAVPVVEGSPNYLIWMDGNLGRESE